MGHIGDQHLTLKRLYETFTKILVSTLGVFELMVAKGKDVDVGAIEELRNRTEVVFSLRGVITRHIANIHGYGSRVILLEFANLPNQTVSTARPILQRLKPTMKVVEMKEANLIV